MAGLTASPVANPINNTSVPGQSNATAIPQMPTLSPMSPVTQAQANPYVPTLSIPGSTTPAISTQDGDHTVMGDFKQTYGAGTGSAIVDQLAGLGTATDSAVQATTQAAYTQGVKTSAGIDSKLAAAGISKDSSTSALSQGDFWSSWSDNLNSTVANMQLSEKNTLLSTLLGEGQAHGGDSSWTDSIGDVFGLMSSSAGAVSQGFGVDDNSTFGKVLSTAAMMAL